MEEQIPPDYTDDAEILVPEPEPGPPPGKPVWGGWATAGFGIVILIATLVVGGIVDAVIGVAVMVAQGYPLDSISSIYDFIGDYTGIIVAVTAVINAIIGTALIWLIIKVKRGPGFRDYLGFRRTTVKAVIFSLLAFAAYFGITTLFESLFGYSGEETTTGLDFYNTRIWPAFVWLAICIIGPVYEEIWIRGFLFEGFVRSRLGLAWTLVVTSAFWAVQHLQYDIYPIVVIFLFGIILGLVRHHTRSIWPAIIIHVMNNTVVMVLMALAGT